MPGFCFRLNAPGGILTFFNSIQTPSEFYKQTFENILNIRLIEYDRIEKIPVKNQYILFSLPLFVNSMMRIYERFGQKMKPKIVLTPPCGLC
ncbi:MAG: hypothetical protein C4530_09605 [Desulfobacteraceae bacterium]|nr:MAG: hypothetical protein C4530_09605 [Desulfobacteraceae bacterium]